MHILRGVCGLFFAALAAAAVQAQVVTEETIITDSVDLFSEPPRDSVRHPALAMAGSLLIPGLGQQYLRRPGRALVYYSTDLLCLFGAIVCEGRSRRMMEDSRTIAWAFAGARGGPGADSRYWQAVASYEDSRGYNNVQELNRTPENKYVDPHLQWAWVDTAYQRDYMETRDNATSFHVASTFLVGAMVLNRLVSFIDARVTTRRRSTGTAPRVSVHPSFDPSAASAGVSISSDF